MRSARCERLALASLLAIVAAVLAAVGCKKKEAPTLAQEVAHAAQTEPAPAPPVVAPPASGLTLSERLFAEARARPPTALRAEVVLDAIDKVSPLGPRHQYVGVTVGASYCSGANTKSGLAISVCEYKSPADAARGRAMLETRYRTVRKQLFTNRATLLNIGLTGALPAAPEETKRIAGVFAALK